MINFEQIETRNISGKGVLYIPETHLKDRAYILYADVVRPPKTKYQNFAYNPPKSFYAKLVFMKGDYVVEERSLEFANQRFDFIPDISSETLLAVQCSYKGVLQSFFNLGNALLLPSISLEDKIKDYQRLSLNWSVIRVVCYADTGIRLVLKSLAVDKCGDFPPPPPPDDDPPPSPPPTPPGEPFETSPPYSGSGDGDDDPSTGDNGNTDPFDGDSPPPADPCEGVGVWSIVYNATPGGLNTTYFKGKIDDTFELRLVPTPGCRDGMSQALYSADVLIYPGFTCTSRAELVSFSFSLVIPPGAGAIEPNPRYPEC